MKIRGNIRSQHIALAAQFATRASCSLVTYEVARRWSPRREWYGGEVFLYGDGTLRRRRSAHDRDEYAATWEQWGHFINYLYCIDEDAKIGRYTSRFNFDNVTQRAFMAPPRQVAA